MATIKLTKEQLFADLNKDGIRLGADIIMKAKNEDSVAINRIGVEYYDKQQYDKAMAWYRLAAAKNNSIAQNNIGILYGKGLGVPQDYLLALEWYLKSAIQNNNLACSNIGSYFDEGKGVPVNKYKALEWYNKYNEDSNGAKRLTSIFNTLKKKDKNKSIEQLVMETEELVWPGKRFTIEKQLREEIDTLKQLMNKMEEESRARNNEMNLLKEENQTLRLRSERQQQELDVNQESIEQYKINVQTINNELQALKQSNQAGTLKMKEETSSRNKEIASLKKEVQSLRAIAEHKQQEINTHLESIDQYKRKEQTINNELQALKQENNAVTLKIKAKESMVNALQNENKVFQKVSEHSSQGTNKKVEELERSNQSLERMLEQEKVLKDNQIEVMKEEMVISLEKEKQKRIEVEKKYQAIQRELRNMKFSPQAKISSKQIDIKSEKDEDNSTSSSNNETDYDTEHDSAGSDNNDINYDTPNEEGDDGENENDLNYDSDEQRPKTKKKIPSVQSGSGSKK